MTLTEILDPRSTKLSLSHGRQLFAEMMKNASDALSALKAGKNCIYKGFSPSSEPLGKVLLTDPTKLIRKSRNTSNYYTILFSNLPSWHSFPKRNNCLVATTSYTTAFNYGDVYLVLPFNGAKIGVCPSEDIWFSFRDKINIRSLFNFNNALKNAGVSDNSYQELLTSFYENKSNVSKALNREYIIKPPVWINQINKIKTISGVEYALNKLFDPYTNGFTLQSIYNLPNDSEVWTDSKAYLISVKSRFYKTYIVNV
jgi:hypothetical protein